MCIRFMTTAGQGGMVADSQTQGVLSQNDSIANGTSHGPAKADPVKVEAPSHVTEYYPPNILGCSEGVHTQLATNK